jgi:hypothetical protein
MAANPAPGDLELVREFVNTWDEDDSVEAIPTPASLRDWLVDHRLLASGGRVDAAGHAHAIEVREALRALLLHNGGLELDPQAPPILDAAARRAQLGVRFGGHADPRVEPRDGGVDGAIGRLLAIVVEAMQEGTWPRLKACMAATCQWKVRSFRERHLTASD